jgi:hypothetical protein
MQDALFHLIGLDCAAGMAVLGRFTIHHPEKLIQFLTFGYGGSSRFHLAFINMRDGCGWFLESLAQSYMLS